MKQDKSKAIASFVLGLFFLVPLINTATSVLAIIFGILALRDIKRNSQRYGGKGLAIAGLILGSLTLLLSVFGVITLYLAGAL